MQERILVTGASGFIGSFIVEQALASGFEVWAGVRRTSSRRWLTDSRIRFLELDLTDKTSLLSQLENFKSERGRFDYVVHAAGLTKARERQEFFDVNTQATANLADVLLELHLIPRRFVYLSSLSVMGAIREKRSPQPDGFNYAPMTVSDEPRPNTAYARSKLQAEDYLKSLPNLPLVILRPTGVYGPRERDYFLMARSVARHVDCGAGFTPQEITFIYVKDLVRAVFLACTKAPAGSVFLLSDGNTYSSRTFGRLLQREIGVSRVVRLTIPLFLLRLVCAVGGLWAKCGRLSVFNADKYRILKQRNWRCDIEPARSLLGFRPAFSLEQGVAETVKWYKQQGWL